MVECNEKSLNQRRFISSNHINRKFYIVFTVHTMHCHVLITDKLQHITNRTKVIDSRRVILESDEGIEFKTKS